MPTTILILFLILLPLGFTTVVTYSAYRLYKQHRLAHYPTHDIERARNVERTRQHDTRGIEMVDLERPARTLTDTAGSSQRAVEGEDGKRGEARPGVGGKTASYMETVQQRYAAARKNAEKAETEKEKELAEEEEMEEQEEQKDQVEEVEEEEKDDFAIDSAEGESGESSEDDTSALDDTASDEEEEEEEHSEASDDNESLDGVDDTPIPSETNSPSRQRARTSFAPPPKYPEMASQQPPILPKINRSATFSAHDHGYKRSGGLRRATLETQQTSSCPVDVQGKVGKGRLKLTRAQTFGENPFADAFGKGREKMGEEEKVGRKGSTRSKRRGKGLGGEGE